MVSEELEKSLERAVSKKIIWGDEPARIKRVAELELKESKNCPLPGFWAEELNGSDWDPEYVGNMVMEQIHQREDHFIKKGWLQEKNS